MGELFKEVSNDLSTLVRQELKLAQIEMTEKGKRLGVGAGIFGGAGIVSLAALGTLSACLIGALAEAMDVWLAALIVDRALRRGRLDAGAEGQAACSACSASRSRANHGHREGGRAMGEDRSCHPAANRADARADG
jgi:hypothetical protein